ncbi:MAG: Cof-type HAD-IIB family hydrolase [Coprobacillaceae bacterium]
MGNFKLIALDMDGTLNNSEGVITPKTVNALINAQKEGATVVLASGRPAPGLNAEAKELHMKDYHGLLLSYNGGKVIDMTTGNVLLEKALPNSLAKKLLRHIEQFDVSPIVDDGKHLVTNNPNGFQVQHEAKGNKLEIVHVENICDACDFNPAKILIASPEEKLKPIADQIIQPFKEELSFIFSTRFYLEATMKGIDKASSLQMICERLNITADEVIAFGDAENDISMLQFAGCGVAMGNARTAVKDIADEVTLSNNEDGIAYTLSKYFNTIEWK